MSRISTLFQKKPQNVLNVYCTAGYPQLDSTMEVLTALQENGADLVELGMPYSDPLADGEVIQQSSSIALANGMTIAKLFDQLSDLRKKIHTPVILMGYMNPVLQYGFEAFCAKASATGIDGLIIPDLPLFEFETVYGPVIKKHGLDFIFLIAPETAEERIRKIDALSSGFVYAVSSSSTTGGTRDLGIQADYFKRLQAMKLSNPVLIGFGISDRDSFRFACQYANGAIIGSAYIKALAGTDSVGEASRKFLEKIV